MTKLTDREILEAVDGAIEQAERDGEGWADYVDEALEALGVEMGERPDGSDPYLIARLAGGRVIELADESAKGWRQYRIVQHCECGTVTGERCEWEGDRSETVVIEWMPPYLRASHEAARNSGHYPANGAKRLRVHHECADLIIDTEDGWAERVEA